jgi:phage shock protein PspC (stress-responsive transcriptional regulator)
MAAYFRRQGLVPAQQGRVIAGVCAGLGPFRLSP